MWWAFHLSELLSHQVHLKVKRIRRLNGISSWLLFTLICEGTVNLLSWVRWVISSVSAMKRDFHSRPLLHPTNQWELRFATQQPQFQRPVVQHLQSIIIDATKQESVPMLGLSYIHRNHYNVFNFCRITSEHTSPVVSQPQILSTWGLRDSFQWSRWEVSMSFLRELLNYVQLLSTDRYFTPMSSIFQLDQSPYRMEASSPMLLRLYNLNKTKDYEKIEQWPWALLLISITSLSTLRKERRMARCMCLSLPC